MAFEPLARYQRILDVEQWMAVTMNWVVVQTPGSAPDRVDTVGALLSRSGACDVDMELEIDTTAAEQHPGSAVLSIDLQRKGYFIFASYGTDLLGDGFLRELSADGARVWSLRIVLGQHEMAYASDGEVLMRWNNFRNTDPPLAHDPIDGDIQLLREICTEENERFGTAAMMAVFETGSGVAMDVNWASAPRPAVIISDPIW